MSGHCPIQTKYRWAQTRSGGSTRCFARISLYLRSAGDAAASSQLTHPWPLSSSFVFYPSVHLSVPSTVSWTMPLLSIHKHLIPCTSFPESSPPAESARPEGGRNGGSVQVRTAEILEHGSQRFKSLPVRMARPISHGLNSPTNPKYPIFM